MKERMKSFWKCCKAYSIKIVSLLLVILILLIIFFEAPSYLLAHRYDTEISCLLFIATVSLVLVAYHQARRLREMNQNRAFIEITHQLKDPAIIKARKIIHERYCLSYNKNHLLHPNYTHLELSRNAIRDTSIFIYYFSHEDNKITDEINFIDLISLLEFMEIACYYYEKKLLSQVHLQELLKDSVGFYYGIFYVYPQEEDNKETNRFQYLKKAYSKLFDKDNPEEKHPKIPDNKLYNDYDHKLFKDYKKFID